MDIQYYNSMLEKLEQVALIHSRSEKSLYPETTEQEQEILDMIDKMIDEGVIELYPLKALLEASNNWNTCLIVRISFFKETLLEGIEKGCLAPEMENAWAWMEVAAENNDPVEFMDDVDLYYDILATAAEEGNMIARDIMNDIWEPENIIEED